MFETNKVKRCVLVSSSHDISTAAYAGDRMWCFIHSTLLCTTTTTFSQSKTKWQIHHIRVFCMMTGGWYCLNSRKSRVSHPFFNREWFQNSNVLPVTWRDRLFKVMWSVMFSKCLFMELILWNVLVWHLSNVVTTCFRIFRQNNTMNVLLMLVQLRKKF